MPSEHEGLDHTFHTLSLLWTLRLVRLGVQCDVLMQSLCASLTHPQVSHSLEEIIRKKIKKQDEGSGKFGNFSPFLFVCLLVVAPLCCCVTSIIAK